MKRGRKPTIGAEILAKAQFYRTVAELAVATGAKPHTVRDVLRRASDRGEIVLRRFVQGKSGRAMRVATGADSQALANHPPDTAGAGQRPSELDAILFAWSAKMG